MQEKSNKKKNLKRALLIALIVFLIMIVLVISVALILVNRLLNKINKVDPNEEYTMSSSEADKFLENDPDLVPIDPDDTGTYPNLEDLVPGQRPTRPTVPAPTDPTQIPTGTVPTVPVPTDPTQPEDIPEIPDESEIYGKHLVNILLVGQDRLEGQSRQRSDTMLLVSFNKSDNTITLTSFMRDMYVQIPGYKPNRLNAAYAFGGMSLLKKTLDVNFGVKVDGVVEVDLSGFQKIIDLLGGVELNLTQAEADYFNSKHYGVVVGPNLFNGRMALSYARVRKIDSDYGRTNRQRKLVAAVIEAYKDQPLDQMLKLLEEILPMVTTDMSNLKILDYAMDLFPMIATAKINTLRIPADGTFDSGMVHIREGFYAWLQYNIDFEANKAKLYEVFRRKD